MLLFFIILIAFFVVCSALKDSENGEKSRSSSKTSSSSTTTKSSSSYYSRSSSSSANNDFKPITHNSDWHSGESEITPTNSDVLLHVLNPYIQANSSPIVKYLQDHGITCLYHFTEESNLESIRRYGLISRNELNSRNINVVCGGDDLSRKLDDRANLSGYVRLSFCSDLPMRYKLIMNGRRLVLLKINLNVIKNDTIITDINATDNNCRRGEGLEGLKMLDFDSLKLELRETHRGTHEYKARQAEVLLHSIRVDDILNLDDPIQLY